MAHIIDEKGLFFTIDFCTALIVLMFSMFLIFFAVIRAAETRGRQIQLFEQEHAMLFVDSMLKRSFDENGFAEIDLEQRRILENRIGDVEKAIEKNKASLKENNVLEITIDGQKLFTDDNAKCSNIFSIERGVTKKGKFVVLGVKFCHGQR